MVYCIKIFSILTEKTRYTEKYYDRSSLNYYISYVHARQFVAMIARLRVISGLSSNAYKTFLCKQETEYFIYENQFVPTNAGRDCSTSMSWWEGISPFDLLMRDFLSVLVALRCSLEPAQLSRYTDRLWDVRILGFDSQQRQELARFSTAPRPALGAHPTVYPKDTGA
jgi:hypothetical protein